MRKPTNSRAFVVLVTGGTEGLGRAVAQQLASEGCRVFVAARSPPSQVLHGIKFLKADVTVPSSLACAVDNINTTMNTLINEQIKEYGYVDAVVANAGINNEGLLFEEMDSQLIEKLVATNCTGVSHTFASVLPQMKRQTYGVMLAVSSLSSSFGLPGAALYSASKAFVDNFVEGFKLELDSDEYSNISVALVRPGFIDTRSLQAVREKQRKRGLRAHPIPGILTPAEAAMQVVAMLMDHLKHVKRQRTPISRFRKIMRYVGLNTPSWRRMFPASLGWLVFILALLPKTILHFIVLFNFPGKKRSRPDLPANTTDDALSH